MKQDQETHEIVDDNLLIVVGILFYLLQLYVYMNRTTNGC